PLPANDPSGDYVIRFTVAGVPGTGGDQTLWNASGSNHHLANPQDLGVLFPNELYASLGGGQGVRMDRDFTSAPANNADDTADCFRFEVLQTRDYFFSVTDTGLGGNLDLTLFDASGKSITLIPQGGG